MLRNIFTALIIICYGMAYGQDTTTIAIDSNGQKLRNFYLGLDVAHLWLKGHHVDWQTGQRDENDVLDNHRIHCNRFVVAAAARLGINMERPTKHTGANEQYDWLISKKATVEGWLPVDGDSLEQYYNAQQYANKGFMVVAVCKNKNEDFSGHIALVMPFVTTQERIYKQGPMMIQAGTYNSAGTPLKEGFKKHIGRWPEPGIKLYYNFNTPNYPADSTAVSMTMHSRE